jgi:hypothetical protein
VCSSSTEARNQRMAMFEAAFDGAINTAERLTTATKEV